jgi:hypothetical protein
MKGVTIAKLVGTGLIAAGACAGCEGIVDDGGGADDRTGLGTSAQALQDAVAASDQTALQAALPTARVRTHGARVTRLEGPSMATGETADAAAQAFVKKAAPGLGARPEDLRPVRLEAGRDVLLKQPEPSSVMFDPDTGESRFQLYRYAQVRDGVPVLGAGLAVLVLDAKDHPVVWAASSLRNLGTFSSKRTGTPPAADSDAAMRSLKSAPAAQRGSGRLPGSLKRLSEPQWVIFAGIGDQTVTPRLATEFRGDGGDTEGSWDFVADAESGEILQVQSLVHDASVSGSVRGKATVGSAAAECSEEASTPLGSAAVSTASGASGFTGPFGNYYLLNAGTSPITVTSAIRGRRFDVIDRVVATEELTLTVTPPTQAHFVHNEANTDPLVRAQVNGYVFAMQARDFVLRYVPDYPTIATQEGFRVFVDEECPVDPVDGSMISWYNAGTLSLVVCRADPNNGYNSTAFATPIFHEYGHHIVATGGHYPIGQGAYGEGMADSIAALISGDPLFARGFESSDCDSYARSADNDCQYSATDCSSCGDEIHACGKTLSGIIWDIRERLSSSHPTDYRDIINRLTLNSIKLQAGEGTIDPGLAEDFLTVDDDDGNQANGTPHRSEICAGFAAHGIDCPPLSQTDPCSAYCSNPLNFSWSGSYQSGQLGTGAVCRQTTQAVAGGNCGYVANGRKLYVNGTLMTCNGLNWTSIPAPVHDGYCVYTTPGDYAWAFFTLW